MKKCSNCNFENVDAARFCKSCGNKLLDVVAVDKPKTKGIDKKKKIKIISGIAIAIVAIVLITNLVTLAQRFTFSNKDDMIEYLQGTWSTYDSSGDIRYRLIISENTITRIEYFYMPVRVGNKLEQEYRGKDETVYDNVRFAPRRGWFELYSGTYGRYILTSDGKLIQTGNDYEYRRN